MADFDETGNPIPTTAPKVSGAPYVERVNNTLMREGECFCMNCRAKWVARAPKDVDYLGCPECGLMRGRFYLPYQKPDVRHWVCECGCDLFMMTTTNIYCPNCGRDQDFVPHVPTQE